MGTKHVDTCISSKKVKNNGNENGKGNENLNLKGDEDCDENENEICNTNKNKNKILTGIMSKVDARKREKEINIHQRKNQEPDLDLKEMGPQDGVSSNHATELLFGFDPRSSSFVPLMDTDSGPLNSTIISLSPQSALILPTTTTSSTINTTSSTTSSLFSSHYPSSP